MPAQHMIGGGPSVLFDAVAILASRGRRGRSLVKLPAVRDFVADAYAHYKFVGFTAPTAALFAKAGLPDDLDDGYIELAEPDDAAAFLVRCRELRFLEPREWRLDRFSALPRGA